MSNKKNINQLLNIDGIGETQIQSIEKFIKNKVNINIINKLNEVLTIKKIEINKNGKLKNKTFMFTGKLKDISRAEAKSLIEKNSGKILSSVNKKLDYLIVGEKPTTKKVIQAKELKINIIKFEEFKKMLN